MALTLVSILLASPLTLAAPQASPSARGGACGARPGYSLPVTGRGPAPRPGGPLGRPIAPPSPGAGGWRTWWTYNADGYMGLRAALRGPAPIDDGTMQGSTGSSGLGARVREEVLPALIAVLEEDESAGLNAEVLLALGRIGPVDGAADATERFVAAMGSGNRALAETATLSLGVYGGRTALLGLAEVLGDTREGRKLAGGHRVTDRQRALAAYGLALSVRHSNADMQRFAAHHLLRAFADAPASPADVAVATALALSTLDISADAPAGADLPATVSRAALIEALIAKFEDRSASRELRAQLPVALARIGAPADAATRDRVASFLCELAAVRSTQPPAVVQGALLGLGLVGDADGDATDARIRTTIAARLHDGDGETRGLSALALARVGARPGRSDAGADPYAATAEVREVLVGLLEKGAYTQRGWTALAAGTLARELADKRPLSAQDLGLLASRLEDEGSPETVAALATAAGLARSPTAASVLLAKLEESSDDELRADLVMALGLTGNRDALTELHAIVEDALHKPELLLRTATALVLLGDESRVTRLLALARECDCTGSRVALTHALGYAGDARALDTLLGSLRDEKAREIERASAAAALGRLAAADDEPFGLRFALDLSYGAAPETLARGSTAVADQD
jgi:hypothetical protein